MATMENETPKPVTDSSPAPVRPVRMPRPDVPPAPPAGTPAHGPETLSKGRLAMAFTLAAVSDIFSAFFTLAPPLILPLDLITALLLFMVLGWRWLLLPGLVMEAMPGLAVFPFWVLVVGAIAVWGTVRPQNPPRDGTLTY
jgi:hypothetical protein